MNTSTTLGHVDPAALSTPSRRPSYPTPPSVSGESEMASSDQPTKKKRKAWGQPVPEIKTILPPRKRAKTVEEKEQRKNERILRNRRAADKSRQRQKAAVADLEAQQGRIVQENAMLRELLSRYQSRFGVQDDFPLQLSTPSVSADDHSTLSSPSPLVEPLTPTSDFFEPSSIKSSQPTFVTDETTTLDKSDSPALAPTLNINNSYTESGQPLKMASFDNLNPISDMTQYPAVILCDLQCQSQIGLIKLSAVPHNQAFNLGFSQLLQAIQALTIFQTFSATTLLPMYNLFQILAQRLATNSMDQTFSSILNNFPLIHSLISMPSTPTRPAVFRMKLLSRLLACSPHMARLLLAATDLALQRVVNEEGFVNDPDRRWTWSSLMTIKWVILRLEREHRKIRYQVRSNVQGLSDLTVMAGVDLSAVASNSQLWQTPSNSCSTNLKESWTDIPQVH